MYNVTYYTSISIFITYVYLILLITIGDPTGLYLSNVPAWAVVRRLKYRLVTPVKPAFAG
jgi:hypothetical protein